jgi:iron complex outermembrane receptor protein
MKTKPASLLSAVAVVPPLCILMVAATLTEARADTGTSDPQTPTPSQAAAAADDSVIKMAAFDASSTTLGRYAEAMSSTATKVPTPLKELPSSLQVLNLAAISDRNPQTLIDMYASVVGMNQVTRSVSGFSLRGFDTTTSGLENVQFDGLAGPVVSFGAVQMANVDSIEVLKGPNSILYGQLKVGGAVNIVTKSPKVVQEGTVSASFMTGAGTYGSFLDSNSYVESVDLTGPIDAQKHWLYRVIVQEQDLFRFRKGDYDRDFSAYPSLTYRWTDDSSFTIKLEHAQERQRSDDGLSLPYGSVSLVAPYDTVYQYPSDWRADKGSTLSTEFHTTVDGWTAQVSTRSLWRYTGENAHGETVPLLPVTTVTPIEQPRRYRAETDGQRWNSFDANIYKLFETGPVSQTPLFGISGNQQYAGASRTVQTYPFPIGAVTLYDPNLMAAPPANTGKGYSDATSLRDALGVYGMDQIKVFKRLHFVVGARYQQTKGHAVDPSVAISNYTHQEFNSTVFQYGTIYDVTSLLSAYANWSESFYPNSLTAVDANNNTSFAPEKGTQWESGLKFETPDLGLRVYLAAYDIKKTNVLINTAVTNAQGLAISRLDGGQISRGIELENEWFPVSYFEIQAGGAYDKAYISATSNPAILNKDLNSAPRWSGNLWTRYNVPSGPLRGVGLSFGTIWVGKRFGGDPTRAPTGYPVVPGYFRFDTGIYYKWRTYGFSLSAQNILDRKYIQTVTNSEQVYPGYPRNITLKIEYHF